MARSSVRLLSGALAVTAALIALAFYTAALRPARARVTEQRARVEAFRREYAGRRWVRPVLRGAARDANAIDEQQRAIAALRPLSQETFRANRIALRGGRELPAETLALLREPRVNEALDRLRDSTHCAWSWNAYTFRPYESVPRVLGNEENRAALMLLGRGRERGATEPRLCLEAGADALRVAQDGTAGPGFFNLAVPMVLSITVSEVVLGCAPRASADELARASGEFARVGDAPSHLGESTETELFTFGLGLLDMEPRVSWLPFGGSDLSPLLEGSRGGQVIDALRARPVLLDGIDRLLRPSGAWARASRAGYPAARGLLGRELGARMNGNPLTAGLRELFRRNVDYDATVQARVRALSWALDELARVRSGGARARREPPSDPFTGAPMRTRVGPDGAVTRVWSVGADGVDQQGAAGNDDVAIELPAVSAEARGAVAARPAP